MFSYLVMSNSLRPHGLQHWRPPCPSPSPQVCPSSCPSHQWCHTAISSFDAPFSFFLSLSQHQGLFPMCWLSTSGDQNTKASASASVLPVSIQGWFPLRLIWSPCYPRDSQESSPAPQFEGINFFVLCLLYSPALKTICDHWEDHSLDYRDLCWRGTVSTSQHTV